MSGRANIAVAGAADPRFPPELQAVWSTLPASLAAVPDGTSLVAVDGRHREWGRLVEENICSGADGVLVAGPACGLSANDVRVAADSAVRHGVPVVVQSAWASHPALPPFASAAARRLSDVALLDSVAVVAADDPRSSADVLLDHFALLRAVSWPVSEFRFTMYDTAGYTIHGLQDTGTVVAMSAVRCAGAMSAARLAMYGAAAQAELVVPTARIAAAPARAWFVNADGRTAQPSWYESAARSCWLRLLRAVTVHDTTPDLADLAADIELVASIAGRAQ